MIKSFSIMNYQKNSELHIDNTQSNLSNYQIDKLLHISKQPNFLHFVSFDFLNKRKQDKITVSWCVETTNCIFKKTLVIGVNKNLSNITNEKM